MITSDDIQRVGLKLFMRDTIPKTLPKGSYILNLDVSTGSGTHYTCFACKYPNIYYVDSFGTDLCGYPPDELRYFGVDNGYDCIYSNERDIQHIKSWLCGWYSIYFAEKMNKYFNSLSPKSFDNIIHKGFTKYPSDRNVHLLRNWSIKHGLGF